MMNVLKFLQKRDGYTLAELLAVVSIFVVISGVVAGIIFSTLRGSAKTKITTEVAQNGQYAVAQLNEIISDSRNVIAINGTTFDDCTQLPANTSNTYPTATSSPPTPTPVKPSVTLKRLDGGITILSCANNTIASNGASLINNNVLRATSCTFSCAQVASDPYSIPIVRVSFSLSQLSATTLFENRATSSFNTAKSLRVYSP
jgi:prepilin-type N-terminal cleavage/methylation domain-containing protein